MQFYFYPEGVVWVRRAAVLAEGKLYELFTENQLEYSGEK